MRRSEDDDREECNHKEVKEEAEAVKPDDVRKSQARRLRHIPGRCNSEERTGKSDQAQEFLAGFFIHDGIDQHNNNPERRQHQLWQDADVVHALWNCLQQSRCPTYSFENNHWPTTLLATCAKGVTAACTAGSIAPSHKIGATPITRPPRPQGRTAAFSKPETSGRELFTSCVTFPHN